MRTMLPTALLLALHGGSALVASPARLAQPLPNLRLSTHGPWRTASSAPALTATVAEEPPASDAILEKFGRGIKADFKRKVPFFRSDLRDGLTIKGLASVFFLTFASITPTVGFGALLGSVTGGSIGVLEMLLAACACGGSYALLSGQPLALLGPTGPGVAFTLVLHGLALSLGLPFLPFYAWVGLWTSGFLALCALFSASRVVDSFTRFTDETFAALVSVIYIAEALKDISKPYLVPALAAASPAASAGCAKATLSTVVAGVVFSVSSLLSKFRRTTLANQKIRSTVADFAPTIGVVCGALTAAFAKSRWAVSLPSLAVPATFGTTSGRAWLVSLTALPVWARWFAVVPALMAALLLFMDQVITVHLVNAKDHNLRKGYGYHLDLIVVAVQVAICSLLGLPWCVAATVVSLGHVRSLATFAPTAVGEPERIEKVDENRLTGVGIFALLGGALALAPYLRLLPQPALSGLFLFLGISSIRSNQLIRRCAMLISDPEFLPKNPLSAVPRPSLRTYTLLQLSCLVALYVVKSSPAGVLFPVLIAALVPARRAIERFGLVGKEDLAVLDE